jgi:hypothetical protein
MIGAELKIICNYSPSGRFCARMTVLLQRVCSTHEASGRLPEQLQLFIQSAGEVLLGESMKPDEYATTGKLYQGNR